MVSSEQQHNSDTFCGCGYCEEEKYLYNQNIYGAAIDKYLFIY